MNVLTLNVLSPVLYDSCSTLHVTKLYSTKSNIYGKKCIYITEINIKNVFIYIIL